MTWDDLTPSDPVTVLVVDDNPALRSGLVALLDGNGGVAVVGCAEDGAGAVALVRALHPQVTLLDVRMPGMDGVSAAAAIATQTRVVMLTSTDDEPTVKRALGLGIAGYLVHGGFRPADLPAMVREVAGGGAHLTAGPAAIALRAAGSAGSRLQEFCARHGLSDREAEVMGFIAAGLSNGDIAAALFLSPKTVKNHVNRIFAKIEARDRGHAIAMWLGSAPSLAAPPSEGSHIGPSGPMPREGRSVG